MKTSAEPARRLPPGHTQVLYWRLAGSRRRLLGLNLLSLALFVLGCLWFL